MLPIAVESMVVGEEDPEQTVEEPIGPGDEGVENQGLGDGLGFEDDEEDTSDNENTDSPNSTSWTCRPLLHWLQDTFQ